jgi:HlyD family secretion protein
LEVDAFKDRKFNGTVTEIANSSNDSGQLANTGTSQEATKFQVRIRIQEKEAFRPGMSVTAEIETRSRTNALTVPFASVTTRTPKDKKTGNADAASGMKTNAGGNVTKAPSGEGTKTAKGDEKKENAKAIEVVFLKEGDHAKMVPVKIGISDDDYWEISDGLKEGDEVVSGSSKAINRELEDGKKIKMGAVGVGMAKDGERKRGE